jgi:HK97 gp10 family phage protein
MQLDNKVTGLDEVLRTMQNMPRAMRNRAARPALRRGAAIVRDAASANVKQIADKGYATGLLERSLRVYSLRMYRGMLRVAVMVKRGLATSNNVRVGLYAAVLEYGKENQPPRSWIRKAAREKTSEAFNVVASEIKTRLNDVVNEAKR